MGQSRGLSQRSSRGKKKNEEVDQLYMTPKELRYFQLALRNSLVETENVNASITSI
jgi:hypothetical protein